MTIRQGENIIAGFIEDPEGIINQNNPSTIIKTWTGTKAQYQAIVNKDANTLYNITDDTDVTLTVLEAIYPVGSIYITTANNCPLSTLISGSTWTLISSGIIKAGTIPVITNNANVKMKTGSAGADNTLVWGSYGESGWSYPCASRSVTGLSTPVMFGSETGLTTDTSSLTLSVNIFERTA